MTNGVRQDSLNLMSETLDSADHSPDEIPREITQDGPATRL